MTLTPEQMRILIAKAEGITPYRILGCQYGGDGYKEWICPNYPQSIDAVRAAVMRQDDIFQSRFDYLMRTKFERTTIYYQTEYKYRHQLPASEHAATFIETLKQLGRLDTKDL